MESRTDRDLRADLQDDVLTAWFGSADVHAPVDDAHMKAWFMPDPAFDERLRARFEADVDAARAGELDAWAESPAGALALLVLLDQLPRNLYRKDGRAFASDAHAVLIAERAIAAGFDQHVSPLHRAFFYLPYEHSEDLGFQDRSVALFQALAPHLGDLGKTYETYAHKHRDVIVRFGRFPHRNGLLGRATTPEEATFLEGGRGF